MFMVVPAMLTEAGMPLDQHWKVYLPVVLVSFLLMLAPMMAAERYGKVRPVLLSSVALMTVVQLLFAGVHGFWSIVGVLLLFFVAFNVLEAMQPSLVSRYAAASRGAALGVYNTTQALGSRAAPWAAGSSSTRDMAPCSMPARPCWCSGL